MILSSIFSLLLFRWISSPTNSKVRKLLNKVPTKSGTSSVDSKEILTSMKELESCTNHWQFLSSNPKVDRLSNLSIYLPIHPNNNHSLFLTEILWIQLLFQLKQCEFVSLLNNQLFDQALELAKKQLGRALYNKYLRCDILSLPHY